MAYFGWMKYSRQTIEKFKAGHSEKGMNYKYFVPSSINHFWVWEDGTINALLEKAYVKLGELNSYASLYPVQIFTFNCMLPKKL